MPIKHIISMFEQKIDKNIEKMVLLKGNLPIFSLHDCVMNMTGL